LFKTEINDWFNLQLTEDLLEVITRTPKKADKLYFPKSDINNSPIVNLNI